MDYIICGVPERECFEMGGVELIDEEWHPIIIMIEDNPGFICWQDTEELELKE